MNTRKFRFAFQSRHIQAIGCASFMLIAPVAHAGAVTDGTIGPAVSLSGNMLIPETLGKLKGNNLFYSFANFKIGQGESATFITCHVLDDSLVLRRRGLLLARDILQELTRCK